MHNAQVAAMVGITSNLASHHLLILAESDLILRLSAGRYTLYTANRPVFFRLVAYLAEVEETIGAIKTTTSDGEVHNAD